MYATKRGGEFHGSLQGANLPEDTCHLFSSDPKPRLRWTPELHDRFVDAVTQLGGPDSEFHSLYFAIARQKPRPKTIMKTMAVKGLTLYHLKNHLQVQQHLQIRIEAHGKYLHSIFERACNIVDPNLASDALALVRKTPTQFLPSENDDRLRFLCKALKPPSLSAIATESVQRKPSNRVSAWFAECSVDSCLTSTESPGTGSSKVLGPQEAAVDIRLSHMLGIGHSQLWEGDVNDYEPWFPSI
ncbi:hypothetical protein BHE74_00014119 [Ensete ventricosum]|nr:hypothetical protein BHE74_00014119 [Ensete ventricosum]